MEWEITFPPLRRAFQRRHSTTNSLNIDNDIILMPFDDTLTITLLNIKAWSSKKRQNLNWWNHLISTIQPSIHTHTWLSLTVNYNLYLTVQKLIGNEPKKDFTSCMDGRIGKPDAAIAPFSSWCLFCSIVGWSVKVCRSSWRDGSCAFPKDAQPSQSLQS